MIYLDNAATTMKKPRSVIDAVAKWAECGNPGRGSHKASLAASRVIYDARVAVGELFNAAPENVIFTQNATAALNIAIKGCIKEGEIITSDFEHNSVRRPVLSLCKSKACRRITFVSEREGSVAGLVSREITEKTAAVVCIHKSNITGRTLPVREIGALCRRLGVLFIVDASQSAGNTKIDMEADNIDILCAAGHKGLMGIQGSGVLIFRDERAVETLMEGGSGSDSRSPVMPEYFPDRLEAGTPSTPAVASLLEGVRFVRQIGEENIGRHECMLWGKCLERLDGIRNITVYDKACPGANLLFNIEGMSPVELASFLDKRGICVRQGLHCAPDAHDALCSKGAVRASFSCFTTEREVDLLCSALADAAKV